MNSAREQRGGEVDIKEDRSEVYQGGGKLRKRTRILSKIPESAQTPKLLASQAG